MNPHLETAMLTPVLPAHLLAMAGTDWAARLSLVQAEIAKRQAAAQSTNAAHLQARLWNRWIVRNALNLTVTQEVAA